LRIWEDKGSLVEGLVTDEQGSVGPDSHDMAASKFYAFDGAGHRGGRKRDRSSHAASPSIACAGSVAISFCRLLGPKPDAQAIGSHAAAGDQAVGDRVADPLRAKPPSAALPPLKRGVFEQPKKKRVVWGQ
jgi:hypothetical protein